jgi:photosystem II stability/assembly factor-like uncharacterized protein
LSFSETTTWQHLSPILLPSPILALASGPDGLWAGGLGGVAWYSHEGEWQPRLSGLPLTVITALTYAGGWLLAGGVEGLARSPDGGLTWQLAKTQDATRFAAIVTSPRFLEDTTALAATASDGILRSTDAGLTWTPVNFGLQDFEMTSLAWGPDDNVLAGTVGGIYRSPNGGRAWRTTAGSEELPIAALAYLPDNIVLAALEEGGLLRSTDGGVHWSAFGSLPQDILAAALQVTPAGSLLLGTFSHGLLRSVDGGQTWAQVADEVILSLTVGPETLYAGMDHGLLTSLNDGATWQPVSSPPLHDLRRLFVTGSNLLVAGPHSGVMRYQTASEWARLQDVPLPLTALSVAPSGDLFAAGPDGLVRSSDGGESWQVVWSGGAEPLDHLTFGANGLGWAGSSGGTHLLQTRDGGLTWEQREAPFGTLKLAALQAAPGLVIAVTYDPLQHMAQPWRLLAGEPTWQRGTPVRTLWPLVATFDHPPLFSLGSTLYIQRTDGLWEETPSGALAGSVRRIVGNGRDLLAFTTTGVYHSADQGAIWTRADDDLPIEQVMDIALMNEIVYVLLAGGHVWSRPLQM